MRNRFVGGGASRLPGLKSDHWISSTTMWKALPESLVFTFHLVFKNLAINEQFWSMLSVFGFQWGQYNHYWNCYYQRLLLSILSSKWWYSVAFVISQVTSYEKFSGLIYISHAGSWCKEVRADPSFYPHDFSFIIRHLLMFLSLCTLLCFELVCFSITSRLTWTL